MIRISSTLRKLAFHFLSNWMGYDRDDSFPFDFEPNGNPFGSKSKGKLSPRSYPIQFERKWKHSFVSVDLPGCEVKDWSFYAGWASTIRLLDWPVQSSGSRHFLFAAKKISKPFLFYLWEVNFWGEIFWNTIRKSYKKSFKKIIYFLLIFFSNCVSWLGFQWLGNTCLFLE